MPHYSNERRGLQQYSSTHIPDCLRRSLSFSESGIYRYSRAAERAFCFIPRGKGHGKKREEFWRIFDAFGSDPSAIYQTRKPNDGSRCGSYRAYNFTRSASRSDIVFYNQYAFSRDQGVISAPDDESSSFSDDFFSGSEGHAHGIAVVRECSATRGIQHIFS